MIDTFKMFARYNKWANERIYAAAGGLSRNDYTRDAGVFFKSMSGTLNHILLADLVWLGRFQNVNDAPKVLDGLLHDTFDALQAHRRETDTRIIDWADGLNAKEVSQDFTYKPITSDTIVTQPLGPMISHVFNHQTHHRGQAHSIMTQITGDAPPLDLIYFLLEEDAGEKSSR